MKKNLLAVCGALCFAFLSNQIFASSISDVEKSLSKDKKVNISLYPINLLIGEVAVDVDFKLNEKITLVPEVSLFAYNDQSGYALGLGMNYALSGNVFDDNVWILHPYVLYVDADSKMYENKEKIQAVVGGIDLVYQWMWKNGFNMRLGIGPRYANKEFKATHSNFGAKVMFTIGYAF